MYRLMNIAICIIVASIFLSGCGEAQKTKNSNVPPTKADIAIDNGVAKSTQNVFNFGTYYTDEGGTKVEPIPWKVLGEKDGFVLLLTEQIIDVRPFNTARTPTDWENSTLRKWLNNDFFNMVFTNREQQNMRAGTEEKDLVFLLSDEEVNQYLAAEATRTTAPTPFALKKGIYINGSGESAWWLRSPVADKTQTSYLSSGGTFGNRVHYIDEKIIGVRPAIWVKSSYLSGDTD